MSGFSIQFLTRDGCHLCEEAWPHVKWAARKTGVAVEVVDVESDDDLIGSYGLRIPVVLNSRGVVLAEGVVDRKELRKALRRLAAERG